MKDKLKFSSIVMLSFILMLAAYPNEVISKASTEVTEDKSNKNTAIVVSPKIKDSQGQTVSYPEIIISEIHNIDKGMIIQGDSSIDPYILIDSPGRLFDQKMLDLSPSENQD